MTRVTPWLPGWCTVGKHKGLGGCYHHRLSSPKHRRNLRLHQARSHSKLPIYSSPVFLNTIYFNAMQRQHPSRIEESETTSALPGWILNSMISGLIWGEHGIICHYKLSTNVLLFLLGDLSLSWYSTNITRYINPLLFFRLPCNLSTSHRSSSKSIAGSRPTRRLNELVLQIAVYSHL